MSDESSEDRDLSIVRSHAAQLAEHFDTVQIFVTRHDEQQDGTIAVDRGEGNWYARFGQVKEWIIKSDEDSRISRRPSDES